jgi:hypothetical protein
MTANGTLLFKIWHDNGEDGAGGWVTVGSLTPTDREGSITDITEDGNRDILLFRCDGARSVISRSADALDFTVGPDRVVLPVMGREILAELGVGQSYERDVTSDAGREYRARWTHRGGG